MSILNDASTSGEDNEKLFLAIAKKSGTFSPPLWHFYSFKPYAKSVYSYVESDDKETYIHNEASIMDFMKFKKSGKVSKGFIEKLTSLKKGESVRAFNVSSDSDLYFVRLTDEQEEALMGIATVKSDLAKVRKAIKDSIPKELLDEEKELMDKLKKGDRIMCSIKI